MDGPPSVTFVIIRSISSLNSLPRISLWPFPPANKRYIMNPPTPSSPTRVIVLSGITMHLAEPLKHSLSINLHIDENSCPEILLERGTKLYGHVSLPNPLIIEEKSTLAIHINEKCRIPKSKDRSLIRLFLSFRDILVHFESQTCDDPTKYPLRLLDSKKQLYLDVAVVSSISRISSNYADEPLPASPQVSDEHMSKNSLHEATQRLHHFKTMFEQLGGAKLEKGMKVVEAFHELRSTTKFIIRRVKIVHEERKVDDHNHKYMQDLAESMERTLKFIPATVEITKLNALRDIIPLFYELMNETVDFIKKWVEGRIDKVIEYLTKIERLKNQYSLFEQAFDRGFIVDTAFKMDNGAKLQELQELEARLGGIKETQPRADPCMEGTRISILSNVESKINDPDGENIVWVYGAPGTGKSSVSLTIKSRLSKMGRLVTYFRFDRNDATVTTTRALWCHVAYELAKRYPSVLKHNLSHLREDTVDVDSPDDVFKRLVEEPLLSLAETTRVPPVVTVIDALDECGGINNHSLSDYETLLRTLKRWSQLPKHFKLVVTSRYEGAISNALSSVSTPIEIVSGDFLTKDPGAAASKGAVNDIQMFLKSRFLEISSSYKYNPDWPGEDSIADMVNRAAGNFMWAITATGFINSGHPITLLDIVLGQAPKSMPASLYSLYSTILDTAFGKLEPDSSEAEVLRAVFGVMIYAKCPLNLFEYTNLPTSKPVTTTILDFIQQCLRSVLKQGPTLRFAHKSFDDFLLSEECPTGYAINLEESHCLLARLCAMTMMTELRFNLCDLETSCLRNVDVPNIETKVANGISSLLSYSCRFWVDHLSCTTFNKDVMVIVKEIVYEKLLYWFEAMSLLGEMKRVLGSLLLVLDWVKPTSEREFNDFIHDARRFIGAFIHPITQSAPYIYISALPFAPEYSHVARHFLPQFPLTLKNSVGKSTNWSPCVFTSEHHNGVVSSVTFSPDEKYFVSTSYDGNTCVCDCETGSPILGPSRPMDAVDFGQAMYSFFGPDSRRVWALCRNGQVTGWDIATGYKHTDFRAGGWVIGGCYSGDGQNIVSVTWEGTVTLWNANTGERVRDVLNLPSSDAIPLVSFSPDGRSIAWVGYGDSTIKIWNLVDGSEIHGPSRSQTHTGHSKAISAVSFAADGHYAVSGSEDGTILIWDTTTADAIGIPLATGTGRLSAVAYSHENGVVVSASSNPSIVMVWNAPTHEAVLGPLAGHTDYISAIALSRDGRRVLSASWDRTVRMWDLTSKGVVHETHAIEGHRSPVRHIAFSPCGQRLASLDSIYLPAKATIRVWDVSTGEPIGVVNMEEFGGNHAELIFTPDGNKIVVFDGILQAWNSYNMEPTLNYDLRDGRLISFPHVTFRSTDQRLVTCATGVVRIWTVEDGSLVEDDSVSSPQPNGRNEIIALSPDGLTAIVRDENRNYIWNTMTSQPLPFTFADNEYISGYPRAYSPTGTRFAAASGDGTLRVWDTPRGELAAAPLILDDELRCLAFCPDDSHIAFSYSYVDPGAIWIWNIRRNHLFSKPWCGHTSHVTALAFSPDGQKLASGSWDGQLRVWDTNDLLGSSPRYRGVFHNGLQTEDGWAKDDYGEVLFWVPKDHTKRPLSPRNVAVIGGNGIRTKLDFTEFRYGRNWAECYRAGTKWQDDTDNTVSG